MKLLIAALDALAFAEKRYQELLNPVEQIAGHVKEVAKATAEHVKVLEARLAELEAALVRVSNAPAIQSDVGITPPPADPAIVAAVEEKRAELAEVPPAPPVAPIAIPLSPELQAAIDSTPASTTGAAMAT